MFVTWPRCRSVTWLCGWGRLILNHHPARFGVHRPYGTGNNGVCSISSDSNSDSNAEVPMPRFTNGQCNVRWTYWCITTYQKARKKFLDDHVLYCNHWLSCNDFSILPCENKVFTGIERKPVNNERSSIFE